VNFWAGFCRFWGLVFGRGFFVWGGGVVGVFLGFLSRFFCRCWDLGFMCVVLVELGFVF